VQHLAATYASPLVPILARDIQKGPQWWHRAVAEKSSGQLFQWRLHRVLALYQFLRHEHVSHGDLPIDFREERWAGFFGQFGTPVCFFTIPIYLAH
jgi:hypothetical protein